MEQSKGENQLWKILLFWGCLLGVGHWVYAYHWQHALGLAPYFILLMCPLMHLFMHRHHHRKEGSPEQENKNLTND